MTSQTKKNRISFEPFHDIQKRLGGEINNMSFRFEALPSQYDRSKALISGDTKDKRSQFRTIEENMKGNQKLINAKTHIPEWKDNEDSEKSGGGEEALAIRHRPTGRGCHLAKTAVD